MLLKSFKKSNNKCQPLRRYALEKGKASNSVETQNVNQKSKLHKEKKISETTALADKNLISRSSNISNNSIDSLFDVLKSKKQMNYDNSSTNSIPKKVKTSYDDGTIDSNYGRIKSTGIQKIISPDPPIERIDKKTGLPVYKAHLLKIGEGGGTPLCPFDCDCCF